MKWKETEQFRATLQCIKELIGLYRSTIGDFGISENEFWIWYTLIAMTGSYAQQDVCDMWSLSKQTVNTIIARMVQKGLVHLEAMPGAKNRKCIHLTNAGERYGRAGIGCGAKSDRALGCRREPCLHDNAEKIYSGLKRRTSGNEMQGAKTREWRYDHFRDILNFPSKLGGRVC